MKALLIAEKPSLMKTIQDVYRKHRSEIPMEIDFCAQAGHLMGLKMPVEINPEYKRWKPEHFPMECVYQYKIMDGKHKLVNDIKSMIKNGDYDCIIHAGDPDQEGEILIRETLHYAGNKLPVKRFWSNDLTEEAILPNLKSLHDDAEFDRLYDAALVRQHADYMFGMNATGIASIQMGTLEKLGRVKGAIIRLVVDRENAIENFVEKSTFKRAFNYGNYEFVNDTVYETEDEAKKMIPKSSYADTVKVEIKEKASKAPKLYKLSTLQVDAHKALHMSGARCLEVLQGLYEKKLVSYPRTDCEYISSNTDLSGIAKEFADIYKVDAARIAKVKKDSAYCNDKAISTEGHTGIIPTGKHDSMTEEEAKLYNLIVRRFMAIFADPKIVKNYTAEAIPENDKEIYTYKETFDIDPGFEYVLNPGYQKKEFSGIDVEKGMKLQPITFHTKEIQAKPPARFNDGSIIKAMDNPEELKDEDGKKIAYKIGTPATRANIIKQCEECGYFEKKKGAYYATEKAKHLIKELGDITLFDLKTSGKWEKMLDDIRNGEAKGSDIEKSLKQECDSMTLDIKGRSVTKMAYGGGKGSDGGSLGSCPKCGKAIVGGKFGAYCSGKCGMTVSKALGKSLTDKQVASLLSGKKITLKGLTSKAGKKYNAQLTPKGIKDYSYTAGDGSTKTGTGFDFDVEYVN